MEAFIFWLVMNKSSVSCTQRSTFFSDSVLCLGRMSENPTSNAVWEDRLKVVQKFTRIQKPWTELMVSEWNSSGIFPRIHHIGALHQSPRVTIKIERNTRKIHWTNYFHVYVQRHLMVI